MRFLNLITSSLWLMEPEAARAYTSVLQSIVERKIKGEPPDPEAIEAARGKKHETNARITTRKNVATVLVEGPIVRKADYFDEVSGASSTQALAYQLETALRDDSVEAILLNVHSPGGEVYGTNEFAQMVFDARGKKPIVAYVDGMAASAAYWIASAADEIVVDATSSLGSIGCVLQVTDDSGAMNKLGIKEHQYVSKNSPLKRVQPGTKAGDQEFQARVDTICEIFGSAVARNRGVSIDTVWSDFGRGGILTGSDAVRAGLADRVGSYELVLAELGSGAWKRPEPRGEIKMSNDTLWSKVAAKLGLNPETGEDLPENAAVAENARLKAELADAQAKLAAASKPDGLEAFVAAYEAKVAPAQRAADPAALFAQLDAAGATAAFLAAIPAHPLVEQLGKPVQAMDKTEPVMQDNNGLNVDYYNDYRRRNGKAAAAN